jgi:hypothetical protein
MAREPLTAYRRKRDFRAHAGGGGAATGSWRFVVQEPTPGDCTGSAS